MVFENSFREGAIDLGAKIKWQGTATSHRVRVVRGLSVVCCSVHKHESLTVEADGVSVYKMKER